MVMLLGIFYHPTETIYDAVQLAPVITTQDVALAFLQDLPHYTAEVLQSTLPIVGVFVLFQALTRSFQPRQLVRMVLGFVYTIIGLICSSPVSTSGLAPAGNLLGSGLGSGPCAGRCFLSACSSATISSRPSQRCRCSTNRSRRSPAAPSPAMP